MKKIGFIAFIVLLIDQVIKLIITMNLKFAQSLTVIPNFFRITYLKNTGGAFSILDNHILWLIIFTIIVLLVLIYFIWKKRPFDKINSIILGLLLGGILGNLLDRIRLGYVVDFLDFNFGSYHYPVFNTADICIVFACLILIIRTMKDDKNEVVS